MAMTDTYATYHHNLDPNYMWQGYKPHHPVQRVATLHTGRRDGQSAAAAAYEHFQRIDRPHPALDRAQAPSMSVGDVVEITTHGLHTTTEWYAVAPMGFTRIPKPRTVQS